MSRTVYATVEELHKYSTQPKVHFEEYLNNFHEPRDVINRDTPVEIETELLSNSIFLRRRFRNTAYNLRLENA
jgi:hypothetical protein